MYQNNEKREGKESGIDGPLEMGCHFKLQEQSLNGYNQPKISKQKVKFWFIPGSGSSGVGVSFS